MALTVDVTAHVRKSSTARTDHGTGIRADAPLRSRSGRAGPVSELRSREPAPSRDRFRAFQTPSASHSLGLLSPQAGPAYPPLPFSFPSLPRSHHSASHSLRRLSPNAATTRTGLPCAGSLVAASCYLSLCTHARTRETRTHARTHARTHIRRYEEGWMRDLACAGAGGSFTRVPYRQVCVWVCVCVCVLCVCVCCVCCVCVCVCV